MGEKKELTETHMESMCRMISEFLPKGSSFIVLSTEPAVEGTPGQRTRYASNLKREDAVGVMKTWLLKSGAAEDWMKHIN